MAVPPTASAPAVAPTTSARLFNDFRNIIASFMRRI
jgi:hypothetical protein